MDRVTQDVREGELEAATETGLGFELFFRAESETLFRRLWIVTGNRAEAEDIMQDAFLKMWERWDRIGTIQDPTAYLYRTAMNEFRSRYRRAKRALRRMVAPELAEDAFARADDREVVRQALGRLSRRQRAALVLTEMLGYTSEEAGRVLGVKAATVRALAHQARAAFAKLTGDEDA
jgi:RNA polymerase sigma-70 factor (ECF subfamily)